MADDNLGLEEVRSALLEIVSEGLDGRPAGVHLTYVGAEFARRKNAPFEQFINVLAVQDKLNVPNSARKMVPFIEKYCSDLFEIDRSVVGAELLKLKGPLVEIADFPAVALPGQKYKKAVWAAFIRPLSLEYRRFLSMDTLGFTDVKRKPTGDLWIEIRREFITETPIDRPINGPLVQARIGEWAAANSVNLDILVDSSPSGSFGSDKPHITDLIRIISALPPEVAARWMIPSEVLLNLQVGRG